MQHLEAGLHQSSSEAGFDQLFERRREGMEKQKQSKKCGGRKGEERKKGWK